MFSGPKKLASGFGNWESFIVRATQRPSWYDLLLLSYLEIVVIVEVLEGNHLHAPRILRGFGEAL
jgi:hypothetical protein